MSRLRTTNVLFCVSDIELQSIAELELNCVRFSFSIRYTVSALLHQNHHHNHD